MQNKIQRHNQRKTDKVKKFNSYSSIAETSEKLACLNGILAS